MWTETKLGKLSRDGVLAGYTVIPVGGGVYVGAREINGFCKYKCGGKTVGW